MSDTKEIKISGGALASKKQRSTRKRTSGGGLADSAGSSSIVNPSVEATATKFASNVGTALGSLGPTKIQQFGGDSTGATVNLSSTRVPTTSVSAPTPHVSGVSPSQPATVSGGKLLLSPPKRQSRISLKAKKGGSTALSNTPPLSGGNTRKARKIHLRVNGVTARITKAKHVKKQAMTAPISEIKSKLEKGGIIKKTSKAPEAMLRTMYADLLITKKGL